MSSFPCCQATLCFPCTGSYRLASHPPLKVRTSDRGGYDANSPLRPPPKDLLSAPTTNRFYLAYRFASTLAARNPCSTRVPTFCFRRQEPSIKLSRFDQRDPNCLFGTNYPVKVRNRQEILGLSFPRHLASPTITLAVLDVKRLETSRKRHSIASFRCVRRLPSPSSLIDCLI